MRAQRFDPFAALNTHHIHQADIDERFVVDTAVRGSSERVYFNYDLVSVVVHIGSTHDSSGHYVCAARCDPPGGEAWTLFDDGKKPCLLASFDALQRRSAQLRLPFPC